MMRRIAVIGAKGFVGSAFVRFLRTKKKYKLFEITRENYERYKGEYDIVIYAASNSKKFLAEEDPIVDFIESVLKRIKAILDYKADLQIHISSVDVYDDLSNPQRTKEETMIDIAKNSNYGFHKYLEELIVKHYSKNWLIFRLAGMVGEGLKKNPVYDIIHGNKLWIHQDSKYQFLNTDDVAKICWTIIEKGKANEIYNVCGRGLITPKEISEIFGKPLVVKNTCLNTGPRVVNINIDKIKELVYIPDTERVIKEFLSKKV